MNRAIRRLGIRTSYEQTDLAKPFLVARIMFTGQTDDPELKRLFAEKTFDAFHRSTSSLYARGEQPRSAAPALAQGSPDYRPYTLPPVGSVPSSSHVHDTDGEAVRTPLPKRASPAPAADAQDGPPDDYEPNPNADLVAQAKEDGNY
jgi:hypothetical protein